jgi:hypothetical protein
MPTEAEGDHATAAREYVQFADAWKEGNADLPQMAHAREFLTAQKAQPNATK